MVSQQLKDVGLKVTLPRRRILEMLEASRDRHLSAEELYRTLTRAGEEMSLATIYRVLAQFEAAGLVTRHNFEGGHSVYELNEESHHDHILCVRCGRVDEFVDETIERRQRAIAESHGYTMTGHTLTIQGLCADCSRITSAGEGGAA